MFQEDVGPDQIKIHLQQEVAVSRCATELAKCSAVIPNGPPTAPLLAEPIAIQRKSVVPHLRKNGNPDWLVVVAFAHLAELPRGESFTMWASPSITALI